MRAYRLPFDATKIAVVQPLQRKTLDDVVDGRRRDVRRTRNGAWRTMGLEED